MAASTVIHEYAVKESVEKEPVKTDINSEAATESPSEPQKAGPRKDLMLSEQAKRKGIYLLPNLFTTTALFAGFYAIIAAINEDYALAAVAIFVAMIFDTLDGRVARLTGAQSEFGAEYDSLSDVIAFGLAPALVAFLWSLNQLGKVGWVAAFVYVAGTALRLARFNTQLGTADKRFFIGLASPAAAALVASCVWTLTESGIDGSEVAIPFTIMVALAGCLMVSNFRYYSFKDFGDRNRIPFVAMIAIVFVFALVAVDPASVLFCAAMIYAFSGPFYEGWRRFVRRGA